jgi:putative CocE/NonD family hydrolase
MDVVVERNVPATMRDGAVLRADVFRPAEPGRYPVLVQRTPYNKEMLPLTALTLDPIRAAASGYAIALQDVRGRWASDGEVFYLYRHEFDDGYDTIAWAASLAYSDGRVGQYGVSYMGQTTWQSATAAPPALGAIAPTTAPNDFALNHIWRGGALAWGLELYWSLQAIGLAALIRGRRGTAELAPAMSELIDAIDGYPQTARHRPPRTLPAARGDDQRFIPFFRDVLANPGRNDFTAALSVSGRHGSVRVPALIVAGWHDLLLAADLDHFAAVRRDAATEVAREHSRIVIGPWSHGMFNNVVGDVDFGLRASGLYLDLREDLTSLHLRWFDHWLKDAANAVEEEPRVRLFVQGRNRWRDEDGWPLSRAVPTPWYLDAGGGLSRAVPATGEAPDAYVYDPQDPCPTRGGTVLMPGTYRPGPVDQAAILARRDVLVYTSAPLTAELEVTGPISAALFTSSSAPSTDWLVKLCDVDPGGRTLNVCDGIVRVGAEAAGGDPATEPGTVACHPVDMWATSHVFLPGHRLRVIVTSSDFPRYDRNPNTGESALDAAVTVPAVQRVFHDAERPSHVLLPVVPPASG